MCCGFAAGFAIQVTVLSAAGDGPAPSISSYTSRRRSRSTWLKALSWRARRGLQVHRRDQDLFPVVAGRPRHRPALRAHDQAAADEGLAALDAHAVGAGHGQAVAVSAGDRQRVRHRRAVRRLPRHRHPVGGHGHDVRAAHRQQPVDLGEPAVVADGHAQPAELGVEHRQAQVARFEIQVLVAPQVQLAVGAQIALRAGDQRRVVEPAAVALGDAGHQMDAQPLRQRDPGARAGAVRHCLGQRVGFLAAFEHVTGIGQLGQHHQPRALGGGLFDQRPGARHVGGDLAHRRGHLHAGDPQIGGGRMLRGRLLHAISFISGTERDARSDDEQKPPTTRCVHIGGFHSQKVNSGGNHCRGYRHCRRAARRGRS